MVYVPTVACTRERLAKSFIGRTALDCIFMDPTRGRPNQRNRTRRALLEAAAVLIEAGGVPTTTEVADAADISRRTAYRYFPTQDQLLIEASLERLRPEVESAIAAVAAVPVVHGSGEEVDVAWTAARLEATVRIMHRLALQHERLLRTIWRLTADGASTPGVRPRGSRRIDWLTTAAEPIRERLGSDRFEQLISALATCVGFDSLFVLIDLRGLSPEEAEQVTQWMAEAMLRKSVADAAAAESEDAAGHGAA